MKRFVIGFVAVLLVACSSSQNANDTQSITNEVQAETYDIADLKDSEADITPYNDVQATEIESDTSYKENQSSDEQVGGETAAFAQPEGLAIVGDYLYVANSNGYWDDTQYKMVYNPTWVTVIKLTNDEFSVAGKIELDHINAQVVVPVENSVAVVLSGSATMTQDGLMQPDQPGAVCKLNGLQLTGCVEIPNGGKHELAGFPGEACYVSQKQVLAVGSGTAPVIYFVDLTSDKPFVNDSMLLFENDGANEMVTVACDDSKVYAVAFNAAKLFVVDPESASISKTIQLGEGGQATQGPAFPYLFHNKVYVVNTLGSSVVEVDLENELVNELFTTGAAPNDIVGYDTDQSSFLLVVNSMDNNITRYDLGNGSTDKFAVLPVGSNPWNIAVDASYAYVSGYFSNQVYKIELASGKVVSTLE